MHDAARAIQFIRSKATVWNIDKARIALTGGSAGACTSMWILCHDDVADPNSKDPVAQLSSRVTAAAVAGHYAELLDGFVLDTRDEALHGTLAVPTKVTNTLMTTLAERDALARDTLVFLAELT